MRIKSYNWAFWRGCECLLLLNLKFISKRIRKSCFWFYCIFLSFFYYVRIACWWLSRSWRLLINICFRRRWYLSSALERIEWQRGMNFTLWNIWIRNGIILWFKVNNLLLLLIHQIEGIFEFSSWIKIVITFWFHI